MDEKEEEKLILGRFLKQKQIGQSHRSKKFTIRDAFGGGKAEIKIMAIGEGKPTVLHEAGFLQEHQGYPGFPLMIWSGNFNSKQMGLITEVMGPSLQELKDMHPQHKFSLWTVCKIGIQIINMLEILHEKHIVLQNICPQIFRINSCKVENIVIGDLLHCKRYRNFKTFNVYNLRKVESLDFMSHFMSYNKIQGFTTARRDDLQALFYLLIFLFKGELPWSSIKLNSHNLRVLKKAYNELFLQGPSKLKQDLLSGLPLQIKNSYQYICGLGFSDQPNYSFLRMKLKKVIIKQEMICEPILDWIKLLPLLHKRGLQSSEIQLLSKHEQNLLKIIYDPWISKIEIDSINPSTLISQSLQKTQASTDKKVQKKKHKNHCQLI